MCLEVVARPRRPRAPTVRAARGAGREAWAVAALAPLWWNVTSRVLRPLGSAAGGGAAAEWRGPECWVG
ncbi:hypothetical protein, partial [Streptomyces sp. 8K308]|uniref:hypothetical protein n=1 Tax=Streptomyces sp. 8K308 TaxID=2530388 RepID=UPI001A9FE08B